MKQAMKIISVFLIVIGCSFCTSFPSFQKDTNFLMPKTEINTICSLSKEPTKIKIEDEVVTAISYSQKNYRLKTLAHLPQLVYHI